MGVIGVDHMTINVMDMEESVTFYVELLGFERKECVDMGDHVIQYLETGKKDRLELIRYLYETAQADEKVDNRGMYRHAAYLVDNLDGVFEKLRRAGAKILMRPGFCEKLQFRNLLVQDPNGVEVELVERGNKA